jgi:predicted outer membrane repeat protein
MTLSRRSAAKALWFACLLSPTVAFALVCSPAVPVLYVGTSADINCRYQTLQAAVTATGTCPATIVITQSSSAEHTIISGKNLTIVGSNSVCGTPICSDPDGCPASPPPTTPVQTLSGTGNGGHGVIEISGASNITLKYLQISDGAQQSTFYGGGGIMFFGSGTLTLAADIIKSNSSDYGGGIAVIGNGGHATLTIGDNVLISNNTANASGGGIHVQGDAELNLKGANSAVAFNEAGTIGGGVDIVGDAKATINGGGLLLGLGTVYHNRAAQGAGIAVDATGSNSAEKIHLSMYSTNSQHPVRISGNIASDIGGGIYLKSYEALPELSVALACLYDFRVDDNIAPDGSAIYLDNASETVGDTLALNARTIRQGVDLCERPPDSIACTGDKHCNSIDGNYSVDSSNNPTGSTITVSNGGSISAVVLKMLANVGTHILDQHNGDIGVVLTNCLLANNSTSAELINSQNETGHVVFNYCTITNNNIGATYVIHLVATYGLGIHESIVDQAENTIEDYGRAPGDLSIESSLLSDIHAMAPNSSVVVGAPMFFDKAAGDYRLYVSCSQFNQHGCLSPGHFVASFGVDYFLPSQFNYVVEDVENRPRDQDVPDVTDATPGSSRDIGAYEMQPISDRTFADGFGDPIMLVY